MVKHFLRIYSERDEYMYKYELSKRVEKFLAKTDIHIVHKFYEKVELLAQAPYDNTLDISKLQ